MAFLNLRDRVIETTIAYLGAESGAGATNFAHITRDRQTGHAGSLQETPVAGGRLLSLDWRPRQGAKLNDCELSVRLVSTDGSVDADTVQRVLVDADGLVLVLESDDDAAERNRQAVATIRKALERAPDRRVPVVVQVNHREGFQGHADLDGVVAEGWTPVGACAAKGDGVMETLQRAVDVVVESMQRPPSAGEGAPIRSHGPPRAEGNPLLGALRQILQATVSEQMATLETRLVEQLEQASGAGVLASVEARMERMETALEEVAQRVNVASERAVARSDLPELEIHAAAEAIAHREALLEGMRRLGSTVRDEVGARFDAVASEIREHRSAVRDDVARVVGVRRLLEELVSESRALVVRLDAVASLVQEAEAELGGRAATHPADSL